jgi:glycerate-2-kinase
VTRSLVGRALLIDLYDAAVAGAAPGPLTTAALHALPFSGRRVQLFALGKGAQAMAAAALGAARDVGADIVGGIIVAPDRSPPPHSEIAVLEGDHPLPGERSFLAAHHLANTVEAVDDDDEAIVLLSGGATSLVAAPLPGLNEADLVRLFELLHRSGLNIHAMNAIRKRFSCWGAGRLALALAPARVHCLIVSDVPGDDPADVASGPCTPDATTADDVIAMVHQARLTPALPAPMREHLERVRTGAVAETPKQSHPAFTRVATHVIGSNQLAVSAARARAAQMQLHAEAAPYPLAGEAATCGARIAGHLLERAARGQQGCVVWGGETTVARDPADDMASGGRCQELALAAAKRLAAGGAAAPRVTLLAAGTDGRDGPTDAAGAYADAFVWEAIAAGGGDPERALARHASYAALDAAGALFRRGLTGTNVMDVVIGVVE